MKTKNILKFIVLASIINLGNLNADDAQDFDIIPSSPLDADFYNNDIPAHYIEENITYSATNTDKTEPKFAILEKTPQSDLKENEVYIKELTDTVESISQPVLNLNNDNRTISDGDIYPAAGTFIEDDGEIIIPENLVSIDNLSNNSQKTKDNKANSVKENTVGEFISPDDECISAEVSEQDKYSAFSPGSFSFGYQMQYMNFSEEGNTSETLLNGIAVNYQHNLYNNLIIKFSSNIMGGKVFNKDNGALYSENMLTLGKVFKLSGEKLSLTPYVGLGLRYMNNIFSAPDITSRNTLQLYLPVGMEMRYKTNKNLIIFSSFEAAAIALNQNWTDYKHSSNSTTSAFSGVSTEVRTGIEFATKNAIIGISPYYKYLFTGKKSSSPVKENSIHMVGINAYINF